jgi:hypothetical protein
MTINPKAVGLERGNTLKKYERKGNELAAARITPYAESIE